MVDDARLVVGIARTAASLGARVLTRTSAVELSGTGAVLRDEQTGATMQVDARMVVNAAGVWAGTLADGVRLRPSRGTHLVLRAETLGGLTSGLTIPVPGATNQFILVLPAWDGRVYVGLTDEEVHGDVPDVPVATESEIAFLLDTVSRRSSAHSPATTWSAPLGPAPAPRRRGDRTSDLSRRHVVLTADDGLVSIVGGKLTTYRRMARRGRRRTRGHAAHRRALTDTTLPLVGAAIG